MLIAVSFFSTMSLLVKLLQHIPAVQIVFFRSLVSFVLSVALLRGQGVSVWGTRKGLLLMRGVFGAIALMLYFTVLQNIPLASAVVLGYLAPVFSNLIGRFMLKERVVWLQWFFLLLSFGGILLVEGFDPRVAPIFVGLGILSAFFSGLAQNVIRKLNTTEHALVIIFYFPLVTTPLAGAYCYFVEWVPPQGWDWAILLTIGVVTQFAQYFMTRAIQLEEISKVSVLRYVSIVFALSYGFFFFGETYDWLAFVGMGLTIAGVVLNVWYKQRVSKV